jgi:hypothetical protein
MTEGTPWGDHHASYMAFATLAAVNPRSLWGVATTHPEWRSTHAAKASYSVPSQTTQGI